MLGVRVFADGVRAWDRQGSAPPLGVMESHTGRGEGIVRWKLWRVQRENLGEKRRVRDLGVNSSDVVVLSEKSVLDHTSSVRDTSFLVPYVLWPSESQATPSFEKEV